jgi:hypothetical protein
MFITLSLEYRVSGKMVYFKKWINDFLEKTEKHQKNEVNEEEFNWNNVKRGNWKYW